MLFLAGKVAQLIGMATVAMGLYLGLTREQGMMEELRMLLIGSVIFLAGWFLQSRSEQ